MPGCSTVNTALQTVLSSVYITQTGGTFCVCYRLSLFHRLKTVKKWLADFPLPLGISLKNCMMCDQLEILNREIERFLHTYTVEGGTLNSVMDSLDIIPDSDNGAKYLLEQVFNAMRYSTRVFIISVFYSFLLFIFPPVFGVVVVGWGKECT